MQILKKAAKEHYEHFMNDINTYKMQQVAELENAAQVALKSYFESQKPFIKKSRTDSTENSSETITENNREGDPRLLACYFKALADIRDILSIGTNNAKNTINDNKAILDVNNMSIEQKISLFTTIPLQERIRIVENMINQNVAAPVLIEHVSSDKSGS